MYKKARRLSVCPFFYLNYNRMRWNCQIYDQRIPHESTDNKSYVKNNRIYHVRIYDDELLVGDITKVFRDDLEGNIQWVVF